jgi:segregation and condensation protein A
MAVPSRGRHEREARAGMSATLEFSIELPLFTGPFRLLADLILEQKVDVCDVPVAVVTERFVAEGSRRAPGWSLEETTWFVAVCAALLELKVGRLLPRPHTATEEELLGGASPDLLYARSLELAAFRRVAGDLQARIEAAALRVPRTAGPPPEFVHLYPDVLAGVGPADLARAAAALLAPSPTIDLSHVAPIRASVLDALRTVQERLTSRPEASFRDLVEGCTERIEVVVRFLAVLELYRRGKVEVDQSRLFGDITVRWQANAGAEPESGGAVEVQGATAGASTASDEDGYG